MAHEEPCQACQRVPRFPLAGIAIVCFSKAHPYPAYRGLNAMHHIEAKGDLCWLQNPECIQVPQLRSLLPAKFFLFLETARCHERDLLCLLPCQGLPTECVSLIRPAQNCADRGLT